MAIKIRANKGIKTFLREQNLKIKFILKPPFVFLRFILPPIGFLKTGKKAAEEQK